MVSIWNFDAPYPFTDAVEVLNDSVLSRPISNVFLSKEVEVGVDSNFEYNKETKQSREWQHFYFKLPSNQTCQSDDSLESELGKLTALREVFERSLQSCTLDAVDLVLSRIEANDVYRLAEEKEVVLNFKEHLEKYLGVHQILIEKKKLEKDLANYRMNNLEDDQFNVPKCLINLGHINYTLSKFETACDYYEQALLIFGIPLDIAQCLQFLGEANLQLFKVEKAQKYYEQALALHNKTPEHEVC